MSQGKKRKVFTDKETDDQTAQNSKIVNVLGFHTFLAQIKNVGASYDLQWKVQGRMTGDDTDAAWETLMDWTTVGEGLTDYFPSAVKPADTGVAEYELAKLAWDEVRLQVRRLSGQGGDTTCDGFINLKRR